MGTNKKNIITQIISLDGEWDFTYTPYADKRDNPQLPDSREFTAVMPVPGYWDDYSEQLQTHDFWSTAKFNPDFRHINFPMGSDMPPDASLPYLLGVGWYKKNIYIPLDWESKAISISIGGVVLEAWVWLNKSLIKYHLGHSTSFNAPLANTIKYGEQNEIIIAVANTQTDRLGCVIRGFKGFSAGIYRSVHLKVSGKLSVDDCYLYTESNMKKLKWNIRIGGETAKGKNALLNWRVRDPQTNNILSEGTRPISQNNLQWTTDTYNMHPWSEHSPKLYEIELSIVQGKNVLDTHTQKFGLRLPERGTALRLNGRPVFLRGATEHAYFPLTCTPPKDIKTYRENIRKFKAIGFNWLRFHTWVPSEEYMQAADELGIMIQVEPPLGFEKEEWIDIIHSCRKHPSVIIYCCGNEELLDENKLDKLSEMSALLRLLAPDALFNPQEAMRGIEYYFNRPGIKDSGNIEEPFLHNPGRLDRIREFSDVFGQYPLGLLSYASSKGDWRVLNERLAIYKRPCLSHEICIHGNYLNLDLEHRYEGTRIGAEMFASVRRNLKKGGLLPRASTYYRNSCAWMQILRKQAVETARMCKYIAGYDLLGGIDYHWHRSGYPCGIMNEFYELKPGETAKDVLEYNGESLLLLDHTNKRNLACGDTFSLDLYASLFGKDLLKEGCVYWYIKDDQNNIYQKGEDSVAEIRNGKIEQLTTIQIQAPQLDKPLKITLCTRLSGGEYEITNHWDYWVFPKCETPLLKQDSQYDINKTAVVSGLDEITLRFLSDGGRALMLGSGPFPALPTTFQLSVTGRAQGNLATVIEDHPLMNRFPHDGFCDWQFYSMLEDGEAVMFNDLDIPFCPIVEMVSTFKLIRKQACLFEIGIGKGKLLVCTFKLDETDPATVYLLSSMIDYVSSSEFNPETVISLEKATQLINSDYNLNFNFKTDEALDPNVQKKLLNK